jgi:RNA polymerase sigma factor (sigma-70 family)
MYISNEGRGDAWMHDLFNHIKFFANHRAKKYDGSPHYEDIQQESQIGLWSAIKTFDYNKNFDFYRWAQWNISSKIRNFLYENKRYGAVILRSTDKYSQDYQEEHQSKVVFFNEVLKNNLVLNKRELSIVFDIFILEKTLSEVGSDNNLTPEGVRKIKNKAMLKLQRYI